MALVLALALAAASAGAETPPSKPLHPVTQVTGCEVRGALQDADCTPGAVFVEVTKETVCARGYARTVRHVPESLKRRVFASYGITTHRFGQYEIDHLVSLELGGSNDQANLWPEAARPVPGFHEKDRLENLLHRQVCSGRITLRFAQRQIARDWLAAAAAAARRR